MKVFILAGGSGSRLWPLSRGSYPKQFIKFLDFETSLFQETFKRSLMLTSIDEIYVITNIKYKFLVMGEIEELGMNFNENHILVEPESKNTLPAILYGVKEVQKIHDDLVVVFPSDHMIKNSAELVVQIKESISLSENNLVTFGIKAEFPNTGYGYISPGEAKNNGFIVKEFKEKPNFETAKAYLKEGYLWNSGIFMFNTDLFMREVKKHSYEMYNTFINEDDIDKIFSMIGEGISIDYGVMEKSEAVVVVPTDVGWNDLGSFDSFYDVFPKDKNENIHKQDNIIIESNNNFIDSETGKAIAVIGVNDLIVVDKRDALLICKKEHSQQVKEVVEILKSRHDLRTEYHVNDYRPWGNYKILEEASGKFKIKKLTILQGKKLSYQLHHHRNEHWIVVSGMAKVTIDDEVKFVRAGDSIFIRAGQKHRLENPGSIPLKIIEVQIGEYLEEDDILRFDDIYGRK